MDPGSVLVTTPQGEVVDICSEAEAGGGIEIYKGLLSPGFVNCHCHLELSHMKGRIAKLTGLVEFVLQLMAGRHFEDDEILAAISAGENEMLRNGIVAIGDVCNNGFSIAQKALNRAWYRNFIEVAAVPPSLASQRFQKGLDVFNAFHEMLHHSGIVPHAPYSVSAELFHLIDEYPGNNFISIHNQETSAENELFQNGTGDLLRLYEKMNIDPRAVKVTGKSSLQSWLPFVKHAGSILLVHNVHISAADLAFATEFAGDKKLSFCLCPNANLYIGGQLPPVELLRAAKVDIVLGTDSLASNEQLCILSELKTLAAHFPSVPWDELFRWGTLNGARALGCADRFGSFEKGKKPGVVLVTTTSADSLEGSTARRII